MKFVALSLIPLCFLILSGIHNAHAQNLSFNQPVNFLPAARTDKAVDITSFKGNYFITWKDAGQVGNIHVCYLGRRHAISIGQKEVTTGAEKTAFAPVLRVTNNHIYVLWLGVDGSLKYMINNSDTTFNTQSIGTVNFGNSSKLRSGITATVVNGRIMIASHAANKNDMVVALLDANADGTFKPATLQTVPNKKSTEYPFIVTLSNNTIRLCYYNDQGIYYTDLNTDTQTWTDQFPVSGSKTKASPAIYHVFNTTRLFYIWKDNKKENSVYYTTGDEQARSMTGHALPDYFKTPYPVAVCKIDDKKFAMAFTGIDQKIYLSYFTNYDPARWMEDTLFPAKGDLTLKDIVIPGSHDAGMSVLNGTGGKQAGSINNCNTLTQKLNIGKQLNAGIRMFDLRVGSFKSQFYTKHSSSDCMAESMGGGYGERLEDILDSVKTFLDVHKKEFIILTFSHFCPKEASAKEVAHYISNTLGKEYIFNNQSKSIDQIKLHELAGKVIVTFEQYASADKLIDSNSMADKSKTFLNIRRAYAATNQVNKLLAREELFFTSMKSGVSNNDLIRLDWQLTQSSDEAALVCNDFQDDNVDPVINGLMLLTNVIKKNKSITDMATGGNKYLPAKVNEWISTGTINKNNKPNILYVDVAGPWITDYCIELNELAVYN